MERNEERLMTEKRLRDASLSGCVESLHELMQEDELTLDRISITCFNETPLHIAALRNHLDFAKALLRYKPDLVKRQDSQGRSPLHLASANGYVEMVKLLLTVDSEICLVRDEDGRTPLYLAVMNGQNDAVRELVRAKSIATRLILDGGETILHSCVIYNRLETLKLLLESNIVDDEFVDVKDGKGNTILHTATILQQVETIKYVLQRTKGKKMVDEKNGNGFTALDVIEHMPRRDLKTLEILRELIVAAGALSPTNMMKGSEVGIITRYVTVERDDENAQEPICCGEKKIWLEKKRNYIMKRLGLEMQEREYPWVKKKRSSLLVAATVIATMAYQAGLNPPGGVWQGTQQFKNGTHRIDTIPGTSIMAYYSTGSIYEDNYYKAFWLYNTVSFLASLTIVFVLVSGIPLRRRIYMSFLMGAMWVTMGFLVLAYFVSMSYLTPGLLNDAEGFLIPNRDDVEAEWKAIEYIYWKSSHILLGVVCVVFFVLACRVIKWTIKRVLKLIEGCGSRNTSGGESNA